MSKMKFTGALVDLDAVKEISAMGREI